jgi:two-component sensor histidine kinase
MSASKRRISTRTFLIAFCLALVLPTFALGALAIYVYAATERSRLESQALQTARQISLILEGEVQNLLATLGGLATSSALTRDDFPDFYDQAKRLVQGRDAVIVLRTMDGQQLVNTQVAAGTKLPPAIALRPHEREVYDKGKPYVSDVYRSPISGEPRTAVALKPVPREKPNILLAITVPTTHFLGTLRFAVPEGWIIGVADRAGIYLTHSSRHDEVSGKPGFPPYIQSAAGKEGTFYAKSAAGLDLLAGYHRSDLTGWLVAANIPSRVLESSLRRTVAIAAATAVAILALTALLAFLFSRRLGGIATALAERAEALGAGRSLPPLTSGITEFAIIEKAMANAAAMVAERATLTENLANALAHKDVLLKEVNHRVKNSLQLVASLLSLQRNQIRDPQTQLQFEDAARRINVVAQVHQRLYRGEQPDQVALDVFLKELCDDLDGVFPERNIKIVCDAQACSLSNERIIPVALIINELIANAFKYSYPNHAGGVVRVSCRNEPGAIVISVADDGVKLPEGFDPSAGDGLGMKIVSALARQLRAKLVVENHGVGKSFALHIPVDGA